MRNLMNWKKMDISNDVDVFEITFKLTDEWTNHTDVVATETLIFFQESDVEKLLAIRDQLNNNYMNAISTMGFSYLAHLRLKQFGDQFLADKYWVESIEVVKVKTQRWELDT